MFRPISRMTCTRMDEDFPYCCEGWEFQTFFQSVLRHAQVGLGRWQVERPRLVGSTFSSLGPFIAFIAQQERTNLATANCWTFVARCTPANPQIRCCFAFLSFVFFFWGADFCMMTCRPPPSIAISQPYRQAMKSMHSV